MPSRLAVKLDTTLAEPAHRHGAGLHGAVLSALGEWDPELPKALHPHGGEGSAAAGETNATRPMPPALTPVRSEGTGGAFEIGLIDDGLAEKVSEALSDRTLDVNGHVVRVEEVVGVAQPFAEIVDETPALTAWTVTFRSPTCVRVRSAAGAPERTEPLPHPSLVFTRLKQRWERCSDVALPGDAALDEVIAGWLAPAAAALRTQRHTTKPPQGWAVGGVGTAVWVLLRSREVTADVQRALSALARFGALCGVGDHTTRGMGHVSARPATRRDMRGELPE